MASRNLYNIILFIIMMTTAIGVFIAIWLIENHPFDLPCEKITCETEA